MNLKLKVLCGFAVGATAGLVAGCQTYNFEPVRPLAVAQTTQVQKVIATVLKPNVMVVVDKSGSMQKPTDPNNPNCPAGCGTVGGPGPCPLPQCPTRMSDLQSAMQQFLSPQFPPNGNPIGYYGLTILPSPNGGSCSPSTVNDILTQIPQPNPVSQDDPNAMMTSAQSVNTQIQQLVPGGGTPTAQTLSNLEQYSGLQDPLRQNFILLLTDGEPNCNSANPNNCTMSQCNCTLYTGAAPVPGQCPGANCTCGADTSNASCVIGCLDQDACVTSVTALRSGTTALGLPSIRTIVVGFGLEALADAGVGTGFAPGALNAMALGGGFGRSCPNGTDQECNLGVDAGSILTDYCDVAGGRVCQDGTAYCCGRKYYIALNASDLYRDLSNIAAAIGTATPCSYVLQATPDNASTLLVMVNGQDVPSAGNWTYNPPTASQPLPTVTFQGALCQQLTAATPSNPVNVEFRIVSTVQ